MWGRLTEPWRACFEEAWDAYCSGSIPIGAVLTDRHGKIVSRGRNRIHEGTAPDKQICSSRLAHAEINVLLQIDSSHSDDLQNCILYTTTEPCILCFGAIVMCGVRTVRYAASDPVAGGANLNSAQNTFVQSRNIDIQIAEHALGKIQRVLRTDYVLRTMGEIQSDRFLSQYRVDYPKAVDLGRKWYASDRLHSAKMKQIPISEIINEIASELRAD